MEFKKYLRAVSDAGTRILRSGMHGLNEELGRHRGRDGRKECLLCDAECESVSHVLWDCPAYTSIRPSVDGLYRDGTVHISREMHKQCFITRPEMTSRAQKPHRHRSRTFL